MTPEEQVGLDARRMVSRGAWKMGIGVGGAALLALVFFVLAAPEPVGETPAVVVSALVLKLMALPSLAVLVGTIRITQGGLMLLTGMRIEVDGRHSLSGRETLLTGVFALGWVTTVIGGFALVLFR